MSQSKTNLFSILIIIVGIVGGYLYYTQFSSEPVIIESDVIVRSDLEEFKNIKLDFEILNLEAIQNLRQIGESPVDPGLTGKRNIFAPGQ